MVEEAALGYGARNWSLWLHRATLKLVMSALGMDIRSPP